MKQQESEQALASAPVSKLLLHYALPAIVTMTASSLYNIMDSIFIGHGVGPLGISALAIALPLMNLAAAFGALIGVGASAYFSIKMGEKDEKTQLQILGNTLMLNVILGILFSGIGLIFLDQILAIFGASENILPYARDYMRIILYGNIFTHIYLGLNNLLRASGHPRHSMTIMLIAIFTNGVLDALFILQFGWGVAGAAWATVIAQVLAALIQIAYFLRKSHPVHFTAASLRLSKSVVNRIVSIGMASFLVNIGASIVVVFINNALMRYGGDLYIGAFGIANRVAMVIVMIILGLAQGMQPVVGYNFGALNISRVKQAYLLTAACATVVTVLGAAVVMVFPEAIALMFTTDKELTEITTRALRIVFFSFPVVGFQIVTANFFQSIGMAGKAIIQSTLRQMVFLIPGLIILPQLFGIDGVWMSMPISDALAAIVASIIIYQGWKYLNALKASTARA